MLRMCITIFGIEKAVVLDSGFCVDKGITNLESKSVYAVYKIKNWRFWPEGVTGDRIDTYFQYK